MKVKTFYKLADKSPMKIKKIAAISILSTFTFAFVFSLQNQIGFESKSRHLASKPTVSNCIDSFKNVYYGKSKAARLRSLTNARKSYDYNTFYNLLKSSHDNNNIKKGQSPKGFSDKKENMIELLMRRTNNNYVTAYYQHHEPTEYETWGVFDYVTTGKDLTSEDGELIYKKVMDWYDNYTTYQQRLKDQVAKSIESQKRYDTILKQYQQNRTEIESFNFRNGNRYYLDLPVYTKNEETGEWIESTEKQGFSNKRNLLNYIKDLKIEVGENFADDIIDERYHASKIYRVIINQAFYRKRLTFLRDRLGDLPDSQLTDMQKELFAKLDEALHNPDFMPRSDAIAFEQQKELNSELRSFFKGQKSRRKQLENFKVRLVRKFSEEVKEKSQYFTTIKAVLWGNTIGAGATVVIGTIMLPFTENDYIHYYTSKFNNWLNEALIESPLGTSLAMYNCAKENRSWSIENVCLNSVLFGHLSHKLYQSRIDPNYDYLKDPEYIQRRQELIEIFFKKRDELDMGKFFSANVSYLKEEGYAHYTAYTFLELLEVSDQRIIKNSINDQAKEDIYDYITGNVREDKKEELLKQITRTAGTDIAKLTKEVAEELPDFTDQVRNTGSVREDLKAFIEDNK